VHGRFAFKCALSAAEEVKVVTVSLAVIEAVARQDGVYVESCSAVDHQSAVTVELDGRLWLLYPHPDRSGRCVVALPTPLGEPEPGSELLLPLMPGEAFPWVWWTHFHQASELLPELTRSSDDSPPRPAPVGAANTVQCEDRGDHIVGADASDWNVHVE